MAATPTTGPADSKQLRVENDLLTNEVRRLRAQLGAQLGGQGESSNALAQQALEDITWLVGRLANSPLGFVLRSRPGFRTLMERYSPK